MPVSVSFPKFSIEKTCGEIAHWSVAEGDQVSPGDTLFEVEDDKATVEVDSPAGGYIGGLAEVGEEIDVGEVVATVYETKEEMEAAKSAAPAEAAAFEAVADAAPTPAAAATGSAAAGRSGTAINPTPLARRIASENGLSLDGLVGTGPRGRVQKRDVLAELARLAATPTAAPAAAPVNVPSDATILNSVWIQKGEGLPVAFIHGFGADLTAWGGTLGGARFDWPAIAVDLPCHGASGTHLPADLDGIAADVEATLMAQGVTELVISAHSFGSAVAARIATRGFLRVRALCLFAPAGISPQINAGFVDGMLRARSPEGLRTWLNLLVDDPSLISDAFVDYAVNARADDTRFEALRRFGAQFFPEGSQRFSVMDDLARYLGPVRVVYGRQDRILAANATRHLPGNVALHLWDRCGHMPQLEYPREAVTVLEEVRRSC